MDENYDKRRKKSDKSKDKVGRPSARRVREYEELIAKRGLVQVTVTKKTK